MATELRRHAVYWLPEASHPLWRAGCAWLGRDPASDDTGSPPAGRTDPWRYGFHATLKAPIALAAGRKSQDFIEAVRRLVAGIEPVELPPLVVGELDGFVALRPSLPCVAMQALADRCVEGLDDWRAPMDAPEIERRASGLDEERRTLLLRWGYPHVFAHWRLHLTLTDRQPDATTRGGWRREAEAFFGPALGAPLRVESVAVLEEPAPGRPFRLLARLPLAGRA